MKRNEHVLFDQGLDGVSVICFQTDKALISLRYPDPEARAIRAIHFDA